MSWRRRWTNILGLSMGWCLQVSATEPSESRMSLAGCN
jgi:hypothetical protein